jgi:hypothetical protein
LQIEKEPQLTEEHLLRLRKDHGAYSRGVLKIQTKEGKLVALEPNFAQRLVANRADRQREKTGRVRMLILKARQEGISTWCASRIFHGATLWSNRRALVLADKLDRAGEIFGIYERFDRELPDALRPPHRATQRRREMAYTTDSRITVETAGDPDAGRGFTLHYMHASELAMWPRAEETWTALMQAVPADGGEVYVESTAKGIGNLFHKLWTQAESGDSDWEAVFLPWWILDEYQRSITDEERREISRTSDPWERKALDEGIEWEGNMHLLSLEQLSWRRAKIRDDFIGDERTFRQEYPSTAREAFITSGDGFFDATKLEEYDLTTTRPLMRGTFVKAEGGWPLQRSERGFVRVWEQPDRDGHYVIGADTAEGKVAAATDGSLTDAQAERGGRDFSSADIIKVSEMAEDPDRLGTFIRVPILRQVGQVHGRMAPEVFAEQIFAAAAYWSCPGPQQMRTKRRLCLTGIERNHSSGQTVLARLREHHNHSDLFIHKRFNVRGNKATRQLGWVTDGTTRMPMLDTLAALVRQGTLELASTDTIREMFSFVRGDDGKPEAQEGTHDDRVISLAIAMQMSLHHHDTPSAELPELEVFDTPTGL